MISTDDARKPNVFGVAIDPLDMNTAVTRVFDALNEPSAYVCLAGAHGVIEARRNPELARAYRDAALVLPDGMPMVWIGHRQGFRSMDRVFGPDLMAAVVDESQCVGSKHFLLGGKPGVVEELKEELERRFPRSIVVGTYTPPFRDLTPCEEADLRQKISACEPDFLWVGLSTPKQEIFMRRYRDVFAAKVMIGVGAAFDFHVGRLADSPMWMKRSGLQWLHRLAQEPRRLWRRYLRTNSIFVVLAILELLGSSRARTIPSRGPIEQPLTDES